MNNSRDDNRYQLEFLLALQTEYASIAANLVQVGNDTWAIHGLIPVDGDVLMAEFGSYDEAKSILDQVCSDALNSDPDHPTEVGPR